MTRYLTEHEAALLGYRDLSLRADGTVQSMATPIGYRVSYGAPSYANAVLRADQLAQRISNASPSQSENGPTAQVIGDSLCGKAENK